MCKLGFFFFFFFFQMEMGKDLVFIYAFSNTQRICDRVCGHRM